MIGNVQILKNNGESLVSNGLAHFKFNDTNKQYVIYTLGEQVNELLKIYIGYENAPVTDPGISDTDSASITELLKKIGKNEDISSIVTILPLSAGLYHIHDKVKKVALQTSAFNNIITAQQRGQIQTLDKDEPIMKENTFFDSSLMEEEKVQAEQPQEQSIFANPMQPVIDTQSQEVAPAQEEVKETPQEVPQAVVENQAVEMNAAEPANEAVVNSSVPNSINTTETSSLEYNNLISDEAAKDAIAAVETAQATIRENIVIIKEFIKQQQNKVVPKTIETSVNLDVQPKEEVSIETTPKEEISETPAMTSQVEALPAQYDVVNNLELAPQPEVADNVLGSESDLSGDFLIDTTVNQISAGIDTESSVTSSVAIPRVDLAQQIPAEPQAEMPQQVAIEQQPEIPQQPTIENVAQTPLNEQQLPAEATLPNESQPEMIDTMAMMPQQTAVSTSQETLVPSQTPSSEVLDTTNMSMVNNAPQTEASTIDIPIPQPAETTVPAMENQSTTGIVNEPIQTNLGVQEVQNNAADVQIPAAESVSQIAVPTQGIQAGIPDIPSVPDIPADNAGMMNMPQQVNTDTVGGGEFAIPQIDMNVSTLEQQAPVVMPDGQSPDVNQGLVLTPDAFTKAA